ncbi:MAG: preprotein translocase subunit SecE [Actinobacteria bacterium]|nr:preprotein translocase subunit SecE [Actinomycetota bacterium]
MNRQTKRAMQRRQGAEDRARAAARRPLPPERRKRVGARQFLKEVRAELRKVNWPTRKELVSYTIVVLVSVVVLTSFVFGLDYLFSRAILRLFT